MRKVLLVLSLMSSMLIGCNDPEAQVEQEGHEATAPESQIDDSPAPAEPAEVVAPAPTPAPTAAPAADVAAPTPSATGTPAPAPVAPTPTAGQ